MLYRLTALMILFAVVPAARFFPSQPVDISGSSAPAQTPLVPGIDLLVYHLDIPRPINLFVARLDRLAPEAAIDVAVAHGALASGRETVSGMASRSNDSIGYWGETWGSRGRVVVGINGYYFKPSDGDPLSGIITGGWYARRFSDYVGDAGFAWNLNRGAAIGRCVYHTPRDQFLTVTRTGEIRKIDGINLPRDQDEVILYTPQQGPDTGTDSSGVEFLVEMARPAMVLPGPAMARGTVIRIRNAHGNTPIPFDHVVISASGSAGVDLLEKIQTGDEIGFSQEISTCQGSPGVYWTKTYAAVGGDNHFLTRGTVTVDTSNPDSLTPNSRTAVAVNDRYVYFIVADGWNPGISEGLSIFELARFSRDNLWALDAVTLDSGGSSTMVVNGQVINNTYCNFTRECGMADVEDVRLDREDRNRSSPPAGAAPFEPDLEPLAANALVMLAVEPKIRVSAFAPGQIVLTSRPAELRLGPGSNFPVQVTLPAGAGARIIAGRYHDLNGIWAKGAFWQRIEVLGGGPELGILEFGWIRQDALVWVPPLNARNVYLPWVNR